MESRDEDNESLCCVTVEGDSERGKGERKNIVYWYHITIDNKWMKRVTGPKTLLNYESLNYKGENHILYTNRY